MWDRRVVEKIEERVGEFTFACSFGNVDDNFSWAFAGVYSPNVNYDRRSLGDEMAGLLSWWNLPWFIRGNFNVIRFSSERSRENRSSPALVSALSSFLYRLLWISISRWKLYWANNRDPSSWSRIDMFLFSPDWEA
jgi:hypothetical protein